jgi:hypothetical protein
MTEPTGPTTPAPAQEPTQPTEPPPWGNDFDPARAWHTIQSLREKEKELSKRPVLTDAQQQQLAEYDRLVEASKSEDQRREEAVANARREAETARAEAIRYKAAATHAIPADHFDLLGNGTEEEITARAAKLSALLAAQAAATQTPPPAQAPQGRPVEQLRPGASPGQQLNEDDAVFAALFGPQQ